MKLVWKLLRQHVSLPQLAGFFAANMIGFAIVLLGIQFYADTQAVYKSEDSLMGGDYLILNKTSDGKSDVFSRPEVQDIGHQPFVERIGVFTSSGYDVKVSLDMGDGSSFSTQMFFESVPDDFVDVKSTDWQYEEGNHVIPIVLPRSYLELYNFGFSRSQNLPKMTEGLLGAIHLDVEIDGGGKHDKYEGKIVGFSSRLNTFLVPQGFMDWANHYYAEGRPRISTRVIAEVSNPTDERITAYLQEHRYETDQDKLDASKTTFLLRVVVGVVMTVGLVICILSFYILMLSVYLLVEKNISKLENLLLIGYSPKKVALPYQILTIGLNVVSLAVAVVLMLLMRNVYLNLFETFFPQMQTPSPMPTIVAGALLLTVVSLLNVAIVYMKVKSIWKRKE